MAGKMYDYLETGTADYIDQEFDILAQNVLSERANWNQDVHKMDGPVRRVVSFTNGVSYEVNVSFDNLSETDTDFILDMYNNPDKAKGSEKTFYWHHPTDGRIYVARFHPGMERRISFFHTVPNVTLWIEKVAEHLQAEDEFIVLFSLSDGAEDEIQIVDNYFPFYDTNMEWKPILMDQGTIPFTMSDGSPNNIQTYGA